MHVSFASRCRSTAWTSCVAIPSDRRVLFRPVTVCSVASLLALEAVTSLLGRIVDLLDRADLSSSLPWKMLDFSFTAAISFLIESISALMPAGVLSCLEAVPWPSSRSGRRSWLASVLVPRPSALQGLGQLSLRRWRPWFHPRRPRASPSLDRLLIRLSRISAASAHFGQSSVSSRPPSSFTHCCGLN